MKVHLIKSAEVDTTLFTKVVDFLQSIPGTIEFSFDKDAIIDFDEDELYVKRIEDKYEFERKIEMVNSMPEARCSKIDFPLERPTIKWENLFKKCEQYRNDNSIANNEFVLLLTNKPNKQNWFAALDENMPYNGFIHTDDWDYFINCSPAFPIAYEVISLMLQKHMFDGLYDVRINVHQHPIGCINDMCIQKKDIILKLRTGDVCEDCINKIEGKISMPDLHHALNIMSSLRERMLFAQNLKRFSPLSKLIINKKNRIFLADYGNIEIKLRPLEKALYFLFLKHPDGIFHSSLSEHRQELYEIYCSISTMGDLIEMKERIDDMVNVLSGSGVQKISRIKRVFEESIGEDLAQQYFIKGEHAQKKKIELDRTLVVFSND